MKTLPNNVLKIMNIFKIATFCLLPKGEFRMFLPRFFTFILIFSSSISYSYASIIIEYTSQVDNDYSMEMTFASPAGVSDSAASLFESVLMKNNNTGDSFLISVGDILNGHISVTQDPALLDNSGVFLAGTGGFKFSGFGQFFMQLKADRMSFDLPGPWSAFTLGEFHIQGTYGDPVVTVSQSSVPEPSILVLMGLGLVGMFGVNRRGCANLFSLNLSETS